MFYAGNLRCFGSGTCSRWYFTFDGAECSKPATIEGLVYDRIKADPHHHRQIEGYCNQVSKGHIRVGFWVGITVAVLVLEMLILGGDPCLALSLKKCRLLKLNYNFKYNIDPHMDIDTVQTTEHLISFNS